MRACRADIAELRGVRAFLNLAASDPDHPPADLSSRLLSIAGADSAAPLWATAPKNHPHARRRQVKARLAAATLAVGVAVGSAGAIGYVAAPGQAAVLGDPIGEAQLNFITALSRPPLVGDAFGAVTLAGELPHDPVTPAVGPRAAEGRAITASEARATLQRAVDQWGRVSYSGRQTYTGLRGGELHTADVWVDSVAGQGSDFDVIGRGREVLFENFAPAALSSRMAHSDLVSLLQSNYTLDGQHSSMVANRMATVVAAHRGSAVVARWWIDEETGLLLWQETYGPSGTRAMSIGFTSITISPEHRIIAHPASAAAALVRSTSTALSLSNAERLSASGWFCRAKVGGLTLVRLRSDQAAEPETVQQVLSDGIYTVSVLEQTGRLAEPSGATLDESLGAYVRNGVTASASWQSGDKVITVVTDGPMDLLVEAVSSLPHEPVPEPTTMELIESGWAKILADVKG